VALLVEHAPPKLESLIPLPPRSYTPLENGTCCLPSLVFDVKSIALCVGAKTLCNIQYTSRIVCLAHLPLPALGSTRLFL